MTSRVTPQSSKAGPAEGQSNSNADGPHPIASHAPLLPTHHHEKWDPSILENWRDGRGQERSPCPFLNTIANHNLIQFSGQKISTESLRHVMRNVFGIHGPLLSFLVNSTKAIAAKNEEETDATDGYYFDLPQLNEHNLFEHDASLTRERYTKDEPTRAVPRNKERIDGLLSYAENGYITQDSIARWRSQVRRQEENDGRDPPSSYPIKNRVVAAGEAVLLLDLIGKNGKLSVRDAEQFLGQERLPDDFKPPDPSMLNNIYFGWRLMNTFAKEEYTYWRT